MRYISRQNTIFILYLLLGNLIMQLTARAGATQQTPKNILLIMSDDMPARVSPPYMDVKNPVYNLNLVNARYKQFIDTSTAFYGITQVSVCAPTRASLLLGRSPTKTRLGTFEILWPQAAPNIQSIFGYFKNRGYYAFIAGKIFHTDSSFQNSQLEFNMGQLSAPHACTDAGNSGCLGYMWCQKPAAQLADNCPVNSCINTLNQMAKNKTQRFIIGCGIHRDHLTWEDTGNYLSKITGDIVDHTTPIIPGTNDFHHSLAYRADYGSAKYRVKVGTKYQRIIQKPRKLPGDIFQAKYASTERDIHRHHYAMTLTAFDNIGKILTAVDNAGLANTTDIIFLADHGFQLGERGLLGKNSLYPEATDVPFIIHKAGQEKAYFNKYPVNTMSLYATLIELQFGKDAVTNFNDGSGLSLDSKSLVPALTDENVQVDDLVITQYPRCNPLDSIQKDDCMNGVNSNASCKNVRPVILFMGYSVVSDTYRITEWLPYNDVRTICSKPTWPNMPAILQGIGEPWWQIDKKLSGPNLTAPGIQPEVYAIRNGKIVSDNLANNPTPEIKDLMQKTSVKLRQRLKSYM